MSITIIPTAAEVLALTGVTVTGSQIAAAVTMVETASGAYLVAVTGGDTLPTYRTRDARQLRQAVIWQACYVKEHPELFTERSNLTAASANGVSVSYGDGGNAESNLSNLAAMALRRLSWRRSRGVSMVSRPRVVSAQTLVHDGADGEWTPLR